MEETNLLNPYEVDRADLRQIFDYRVELPNAHRGEDLTMALSLVRSFPDLDFGECDVANTLIGQFMIFGSPNGDSTCMALDSLGVKEWFFHRRGAVKYLSDRYRYLLALSIIKGSLVAQYGPPYPHEEETISRWD